MVVAMSPLSWTATVVGRNNKVKFAPLAIKQERNLFVAWSPSRRIMVLKPAQEVSALMELFVWALDSEVKSLHRHNVRLRIIGETTRFNARLQERIRKAEALTANNTGLTLNIAANYGGRWDIVQGARQLAEQVQNGLLKPEEITEELLSQQVCMIWQIAYAELYFTDVLWPDFAEQDFEGALHAFVSRERRFGGTEEPGGSHA